MIVETAATLAAARLLVLLLPLHVAAGRMAKDRRCRVPSPDGSEAKIATLVRWLPSTARVMPFRALCLEQALAGALMLRRRGIATTLHLGTRRNGGSFEAHAWLCVQGVVVIGGPIDNYVERARL